MILKIGLNWCCFWLGFENMMNCWRICCWFYVFVLFECYDVYKTCKRFCKSFWVIGGSKLGFWMKMGF